MGKKNKGSKHDRNDHKEIKYDAPVDEEKHIREITRGKIGKGIGSALRALIAFIVIPLLIVMAIDKYVPDAVDLTGFKEVMDRSINLGIVMAVLAFFKGFYQRGNKYLLLMSFVYMIMSIVWIVYVLNFGVIENMTIDMDSNVITLDLVVTGIIMLGIILKVIDLIIAICDFRDFRKLFLAGVDTSKKGYKKYKKEKKKELKHARKD